MCLLGQVEKGHVMSKVSEGYSKFGSLINFTDIDSLVGQLLTYVDATYQDLEQRNAHKSIVKRTVRNWYRECEKELPIYLRGEFEDMVPVLKRETA